MKVRCGDGISKGQGCLVIALSFQLKWLLMQKRVDEHWDG